MTPDLSKIIELSNIHPLKIRNVYLYGSRVYGYNKEDSDFDVIMVAPNLIKNSEIKDVNYNIHIVTPDSFKEELQKCKITYLECVYAPEWAILQQKEKYDLKFSKNKIKKEILAQSFSAWRNAKFKMNQGDTMRGVKSAYHSFKILHFGIQMIQHGKIINFSECNELHEEFHSEEFYEWIQIKEKYLEIKKHPRQLRVFF